MSLVNPSCLLSDLRALLDTFTVALEIDGKDYLRAPVYSIQSGHGIGGIVAPRERITHQIQVSPNAKIYTVLESMGSPQGGEDKRENYRHPFYVDSPLTIEFALGLSEDMTILITKHQFSPGTQYINSWSEA